VLILQLTNLTVIERSRKGTGFDYWLGIQDSTATMPFQRIAASLAIKCGELRAAERLIATPLTKNPPPEIAEELKDLFIQINLSQYLKRQGIHIDINEVQVLVDR